MFFKFFKKTPILNKFGETFWNYLLVSIIATVMDIGLLFSLTEFVGINYLISATISFCAGTTVAYIGQKYFTFKDENKQIAKQFGLFAFISIIGLLINLGIIKLFVEVFGVHYMIGKVVAIGVGFFWNYSANKKFTFKNGKERK